MTPATVTSRIRGFLVEHFPSAQRQPLAEDDHLLANGILASLGVLDLVSYLEREFAITVSDEDLVPENFETLRTVTAFVQEKRTDGQR